MKLFSKYHGYNGINKNIQKVPDQTNFYMLNIEVNLGYFIDRYS